MRKFFFIIISYLFASQVSIAQTIQWSSVLTERKKEQFMQVLGANDNGDFYMLRSNYSLENGRERSWLRNRVYVLQFFNSELSLIWEKELKTSYSEGHISDVRMINGKVIVTSYLVNKKARQYYFFAHYIDETGKWINQPAMLDSIASDNLDETIRPGIINTRDQALMAFCYRRINKETKTQSYQVIVMDTGLAISYKKQIDVDAPENLFVPLNFILTDQGSVFILGIHYASEKKVKAPGQSYYELYGYNNLLDRLVTTSIKSEDKFLTDVGISNDNINRSIVVAGFYSDKTVYSTAGVFYYSLTEDSLKETKMINSPFSTEYLQKFMSDKKENRELVNYSIDRLILRKDGGVGLIAESMYQTTRSYFDYYMQTLVSHNYYHNGNIMVLSINPDGKIMWNNVITKDQNSVDDYAFYSSYYCAITGGRLAAFYNKYIDSESSILMTVIDASGKQKTDVLFNEIEKVIIIPRSGKQIDEETILLPAYKQNKFHLIKLSF